MNSELEDRSIETIKSEQSNNHWSHKEMENNYRNTTFFVFEVPKGEEREWTVFPACLPLHKWPISPLHSTPHTPLH